MYSMFVCFRSTISREKFEELCADLWERALVPLKEVLRNSGLKIDDIYAVELIGGATRVPKLQVTSNNISFSLALIALSLKICPTYRIDKLEF